MDIALVVDAEHLTTSENARLLAPALATRGLDARLIAWDDAAMDWSLPRVSVIRATWDYHLRREEFLRWAERASALTALWNPLALLRWNTHKSYLRDLRERGVRIVPTVWLPFGAAADLPGLLAREGWSAVVVKPAVSASAFATMLVTPETLATGQAHLTESLDSRDMMVQPYLSAVVTEGERSLVYIDGQLTHTVRRAPALSAVADEWNWDRLVANDPAEDAFASSVLERVGQSVLYARVDLIRDDAGNLCLMELELVEPSLGLDLAPWAADRFADAIAARL